MIKINYFLGRKRAKITTVFASCYIGGKKFTTSTKIKIQPKDWDFREWWNEEFKLVFSLRIGEWAYGILNKFPPFSLIKRDEKWNTLKSIAFMNVKKTGGGGRSDYDEIQEYIKDDLYFIRKEIEIIDPEIIISSIGIEANKKIFEGEWEDTNYCVYYLKTDNRTVIDYYHPSSQGGAPMGYVLLQKVLEIIS